MTVNPEQTAAAAPPSDKELNFRKLEAKLELERQSRQQAEERLSHLEKIMNEKKSHSDEEDEPSDEPYIDNKRLQKSQARMEKKIVGETDNRIQQALIADRKQRWLDSNPDFHSIMDHAQTFADKYPQMAKSILNMPEGFERQQLVYDAIKDLGLHKKQEDKESIQTTIDKNRFNYAYQPTGIGTAPYNGPITFDRAQVSTKSVQKSAYEKMKQMQARGGVFN
jgi:hypothetical protein